MTASRLAHLSVVAVVVTVVVGPSAGARSETVEPVAVTVDRQGWPWLSMIWSWSTRRAGSSTS
jgi:hypothetical protein